MTPKFVTSRLAIGDAIESRQDVYTLKNLGVTHVINCRQELDDMTVDGFADAFRSANMPSVYRYQWSPTEDDGKPKPLSWFGSGITFGLAVLCVAQTKLYVHCAGGRNRGPSMGYAIMRAWGLSPDEALERIHKNCPSTLGGVCYAKCADTAVVALQYISASLPNA